MFDNVRMFRAELEQWPSIIDNACNTYRAFGRTEEELKEFQNALQAVPSVVTDPDNDYCKIPNFGTICYSHKPKSGQTGTYLVSKPLIIIAEDVFGFNLAGVKDKIGIIEVPRTVDPRLDFIAYSSHLAEECQELGSEAMHMMRAVSGAGWPSRKTANQVLEHLIEETADVLDAIVKLKHTMDGRGIISEKDFDRKVQAADVRKKMRKFIADAKEGHYYVP